MTFNTVSGGSFRLVHRPELVSDFISHLRMLSGDTFQKLFEITKNLVPLSNLDRGLAELLGR